MNRRHNLMEFDIPAVPAPVITELNAPFWQGLKSGVLSYQRCQACGHAWLPADRKSVV